MDIASTRDQVFEAHITYRREHAEKIRLAASELDWKFSQIDGDPVLGTHVYCYLTAYDITATGLLDRMEKVVYELTMKFGFPPIRTKIEQVLYDKRW